MKRLACVNAKISDSIAVDAGAVDAGKPVEGQRATITQCDADDAVFILSIAEYRREQVEAMELLALATTVLATAMCYAASDHQQWSNSPLPAFPAYGSATLSVWVAVKAWIAALSPVAGAMAWLTTTMLSAVLLTYTGALFARRAGA